MKKIMKYLALSMSVLVFAANFFVSATIIEQFQEGDMSQRKSIAEKIWANPGNYNPAELIRAAAYFTATSDYDKGTLLFCGAMIRARIDVEASKDKTLSDVPIILQMTYMELCGTLNASPDYVKREEPFFYKNIKTIVMWDTKTPRNYDCHWADAHGMKHISSAMTGKQIDKSTLEISEKEYERAIEKVHAEYKNGLKEKGDSN